MVVMMSFTLSAEVLAEGDVEPPAPARIHKIKVLGNDHLRSKEILAHIRTEKPSWIPWRKKPALDERGLDTDMDLIRAFYRRYGFYEVEASYTLDWNRAATKAKVLIQVEEGEPVRLEQLEVFLPLPADKDEAWRSAQLAGLDLVEGEVFAFEPYAFAKERILRRLSNQGYPRATVQGGAEVDVDRHAAEVSWSVALGPLVRFGPVVIEGLEEVDPNLVEREITFTQGAPYSSAEIDQTQRQIFGLKLFRTAVIEAERLGEGDEAEPDDEPEPAVEEAPQGSPSPEPAEVGEGAVSETGSAEDDGSEEEIWPIRIGLTERPPKSVRVGVGYGTEDKFRARIGWTHHNFFGAGRNFTVSANYSSLQRGVELELLQPRFYDSKLLLKAHLMGREKSVPAYDSRTLRTGLGFSRNFSRLWSGGVSMDYEWNDVFNVSGDPGLDLSNPAQKYYLTLFQLSAQRLKKGGIFLFGEGGSRMAYAWQFSPPFLSEFTFNKLTFDGQLEFPILGPLKLFTRTQLGVVLPYGDTDPIDVPLPTRFYAGGSSTMRGYDYQKLPPLDKDGNPIGGTTQVLATLELRYGVIPNLDVLAFFDLGHLNLEPLRIDLRDFYYAIGPGVQYKTPVGALKLSIGYPLNPPEGMKQEARFHLGIGVEF